MFGKWKTILASEHFHQRYHHVEETTGCSSLYIPMYHKFEMNLTKFVILYTLYVYVYVCFSDSTLIRIYRPSNVFHACRYSEVKICGSFTITLSYPMQGLNESEERNSHVGRRLTHIILLTVLSTREPVGV